MLGNGKDTTKSPHQAADDFIQREYPELQCDDFVGSKLAPEIFLSKNPEVIEKDEEKWSTEQKKAFQKYGRYELYLQMSY